MTGSGRAAPRDPIRLLAIAMVAIIVAVALGVAFTFDLSGRPGPGATPSTVVVGAHPLIGQPAPAFSLKTLDGRTVSLADYRGRPVVVNFWASYCEPCKVEFPLFKAARDRHAAAGLEILGIVKSDDDLDAARRFAAAEGAGWPLLPDAGGATAAAYRADLFVPITFYVDRAGVVRAVSLGPPPSGALDDQLAEVPVTAATAGGAVAATVAVAPAIKVENLVKRYDGRAVVDDLDLTVHRGEILALLGPNGAGKTTTVEIIEGFRRPDSGTVSVLGLDPRRDGPRLRQRMGLMLQRGELQSQIRVLEAVELFAAFYPHPMDVRELLAKVGLSGLVARRYRSLSGGERQRLDLAVALVGRPDVAILDEPTASMDAGARRTSWGLLRSLRQEGASILLTTHLLAEAEELADRVAIIDRGRLVALGTPAELRAGDEGTASAGVVPGGTGADAPPQARSQRTHREIRLELRSPLPAAREARLARLGGVVRVRTTRPGVYLLSTDSPTELLMELSAWLWALGIEPLGIQLGQASLEDVFLRLVGEREQP